MSTLSVILQAAFWLSVVALFHSYAFYPLLLRWLARNRRNNELVHTSADPDAEWPHLVAVMAAHNEESVIGATLDSIFASNYPADRFEVIVAADNCSDRTVEIVERFQARHPNLCLRTFSGRNGKIRSLNLMLEEIRERLSAKGDHVLILCDANVRWSGELPRELAKHFRNPRIGMVAPNVLDGRSRHAGIADQEEAYVNRENTVKYHEGVLWGRMMGAFGACFAMRGRLFSPIPENFRSDDFTHTMRCFEQGFDAIVEPAAIAWEDVSEDIEVEFGRKKRISVGNFQNLGLFWNFLQPGRAGWATWFAFWSHKGLRWFGPFLIVSALLNSAVLVGFHWIYTLALAGQLSLIAGAVADSALSRRGIHFRALRYARYFLLMNVALAVGAWRFVAGEKNAFWEPAKRVVAEHSPPASALPGSKEANSVPAPRSAGSPV
jgi:cellulose synthase/poly-beta-1,6-N-acetylglucosamine synthase-like glycosyltransferase